MGLAASRQEAFWEACGFGHVNRVRKFLEDPDIDVNWVSYTHDCCPIHVASQGKPEIVEMLINANCNVNVKDIRGNLPIHHAAMKGHADIIQTLINNGSEVNTQDKNGWTALHCAAYWNYPEAVRVLIKNNADVHLQNKDERTALHETARSPEQNDQKLGEISRMLIDAGCDINAKSSDLGEADFTGLMFSSYHNHPEVSSAFIEAGCDINAQGTNLWTALHWAADRGNEEMVYLLLESGADPTIKGLRGELAANRAQNSDVKDVLMNAVNMWEELAELDKIGGQTFAQKTVPVSTKSSTKFENKMTVDAKNIEKLHLCKTETKEKTNKQRSDKSQVSKSEVNITGTDREKEQQNTLIEGIRDMEICKINSMQLEGNTERKGKPNDLANLRVQSNEETANKVEKENENEEKKDRTVHVNESHKDTINVDRDKTVESCKGSENCFDKDNVT